MIVRIVRMQFRPDEVKAFHALFAERRARIAGFIGCRHLELWQETGSEAVFFTYSHWEGEEALARYRASRFFRDTWALAKALFAAPAQAWSASVIEP